jgi:hypothetical protein
MRPKGPGLRRRAFANLTATSVPVPRPPPSTPVWGCGPRNPMLIRHHHCHPGSTNSNRGASTHSREPPQTHFVVRLTQVNRHRFHILRAVLNSSRRADVITTQYSSRTFYRSWGVGIGFILYFAYSVSYSVFRILDTKYEKISDLQPYRATWWNDTKLTVFGAHHACIRAHSTQSSSLILLSTS